MHSVEEVEEGDVDSDFEDHQINDNILKYDFMSKIVKDKFKVIEEGSPKLLGDYQHAYISQHDGIVANKGTESCQIVSRQQ